MSKAQAFECPNCKAPLDYDGSGDLTINCPYCNTAVIVPETLRDTGAAPRMPPTFAPPPEQADKFRELGRLVRSDQKIEAIKLYREMFGVGLREAKEAVDQLSQGRAVVVSGTTVELDSVIESAMSALQTAQARPAQPKRRSSSCARVFILLFAVGLLAAVGVFVALILPIGEKVGEVSEISIPALEEMATALPEIEIAPPSFARVALTFGGEGTGPGLFTDARHVGVDGKGNIYVGEYSDGRIQVFDASGEFVSLWMIDDEFPLTGLAVDRQGTVYLAHCSEILAYEGATGGLLGQIPYAEGWGFEDVATTADGGLVASWYANRDDIVRFDAQGNAVLTIQSAISEQSGDGELDTRVAADGLGNIYALGTFNNAVFRFTPEGKFVNRFGSQGDEPGQFRAPWSIAVDGQGRVYVGDFKGIQVFDGDGRYLDLIKVDGPAFGLAFNDQNELFVAARHQVIKYVLQQP
jgi:uncharacterized Zn finger protein (UPF0148 family)